MRNAGEERGFILPNGRVVKEQTFPKALNIKCLDLCGKLELGIVSSPLISTTSQSQIYFHSLDESLFVINWILIVILRAMYKRLNY